MNRLVASLAALALSASLAQSEDVRWTAQVVHYDSSETEVYDGWVISPASDWSGEARGFRETLEAIYSQDKNPRIKHVYLGTLFATGDLQAQVVGYLQKQKSFRDSPPPIGTWSFRRSGEMQKLVSEALLQSDFVASLNKELSAHKQKISLVSMEKLYFTKEHEKITWHGIVWLLVTKSA